MTIDLDRAVLLAHRHAAGLRRPVLAAPLEPTDGRERPRAARRSGARPAARSSTSATTRSSPARRSRRARLAMRFRPGFGPIERRAADHEERQLGLHRHRPRPAAQAPRREAMSSPSASRPTCASRPPSAPAPNMGWDMILVPDACDCFDLPDGARRDDQGRGDPRRPRRDARLRILPRAITTAELIGRSRCSQVDLSA